MTPTTERRGAHANEAKTGPAMGAGIAEAAATMVAGMEVAADPGSASKDGSRARGRADGVGTGAVAGVEDAAVGAA